MAGKNRKRKEKHGQRTPPLSSLDRIIYYICFVLLFIAFMFLLIFPIDLFQNIMFSDPCIIAAIDRGEAMRVLFVGYVIVSIFCFVAVCYDQKKPIFGNKMINYSEYRWKPRYPLFSKEWKNRHKNEKPFDTRFRRALWTVWFIGFAVVSLLFAFNICCRWTYESDGRLRRFNSFNQETVSCPVKDLTELTIGIHKRKHNYYMTVSFEMDGGTGKFSLGDFSGEDFEERLEQILTLKEKVPAERVFYNKAERLERYLWNIDLSPSEQELINQIFDRN